MPARPPVAQSNLGILVPAGGSVDFRGFVIEGQPSSPRVIVHLAYYRMDGTAWYRRLLPGDKLTKPQQLATGLATSEDDYGSVLPLVYLPQTDTVVIVYRLSDGTLWERRVSGDELPTAAVQVTDRCVVQHAVDSQQVGADVVADGASVRVLFIDESDRNLYSTHDNGGWQPAILEVDGIDASWVRGSVYVRPDGVKVYGYAYDAGSQGGAGFNRYAEIVLSSDDGRREGLIAARHQ